MMVGMVIVTSFIIVLDDWLQIIVGVEFFLFIVMEIDDANDDGVLCVDRERQIIIEYVVDAW